MQKLFLKILLELIGKKLHIKLNTDNQSTIQVIQNKRCIKRYCLCDKYENKMLNVIYCITDKQIADIFKLQYF